METKVPQASPKGELSAAAAARIARKNGATKIGKEAAKALAVAAEIYIAGRVKEALAVANHAGRKVVREDDVAFVIKA